MAAKRKVHRKVVHHRKAAANPFRRSPTSYKVTFVTSTRRSGKPKVLSVVKYQTGKSNKKYDRRIKALPPGKRRSASGRIYWETRRNRSDRHTWL